MRGDTLKDQGYRFTFRKGIGWAWRHEVLDGDVDATDMNDSEFTQAVKEMDK